MSGIYIKGVVAPAMCDCCDFRTGVGGGFGLGKCLFTHSVCEPHIKPTNCPVTFVPDHGRLIDADALDADITQLDWKTGEDDAIGFSIFEIDNAPTIIPAEKEGE